MTRPDRPPFDPDRFVQVLDEGGVVPVRRSRKEFVFACPHCGQPEVKCYTNSGYFVCYRCKTKPELRFHGGPEYLVAALLEVSVDDARAALYGVDALRSLLELGVPWTVPEDPDEEIPIARWPDHCIPLDSPQAKRGLAYLASRGVSPEVAAAYDLRYSQRERRLYFPVSVHGLLVGWQARLVVPEAYVVDGEVRTAQKVLSKRDMPRVLMFEHRLRGCRHAVVTEGPFDALKAHEVGGNVASMGKVVTERQLDVLEEARVQRVYLALDPDAWRENEDLARRVWQRGMEAMWVDIPPQYKDLGEMPMAEATETIGRARRLEPWQIVLPPNLR